MNKNNDFFIGWANNASGHHKKSIKRIIIPIFIAIPVVILAIVYFTKPFGNGSFELGNVQEFTGVYYEDPFPILLLDKGQLTNGSSTSALLVGYGKSGAKSFMDKIQEKEGKLSGKRLKLQGTLINGDGRTLIELTKKEKSVIQLLESEIMVDRNPKLSSINLEGEIIDPKCWFGVMKPAEGKVHKSCAIRCISGGIPPVLKVDHFDYRDYYILKGLNGEDINQEVLPFIGEAVKVKGQTYLEHGWNVLRVDLAEIRYKK